MMEMKRNIGVLLILVLVLSIFAAGCSGGEDEVPQEPEEINETQENLEQDLQEGEMPEEITAPKEETEIGIVEEAEVEEPMSEPELQEEPEVVEVEPDTEQVDDQQQEEPQTEAQEEPVVVEPQIVQEGPLLKVEGRVSTPLSLDLSQLKSMDSLIYSADYYWLNSFGSTGHTSFKGIKLWGLLSEEAGIGSDAQTVRIVATDGYEMTFTVDLIRKQDYIDETDDSKKLPVIVAWQEDGSQYDPDKGPPYKLVVGQKEAGDVNKPQWVSNIDRIIVE